jgi:hypothetical protein
MPRRQKPIKHLPFQPNMSCEQKRRFKSENEALKALELAELMDVHVTLYTYQCPYCQGWHLSSKKTSN